jgi:predicted AlkP superfamily phosphohydrolase/phosphomutase
MAEDHNGHNNERFDAADYWAQCALVFEERERMMKFELERFHEGFFFALFDTPDRVQHMFWRFRDPRHPCYDPEMAAELGPKIDELYQRCDQVLGRVMEAVDGDTLLMVLSDHGFNSFQRSFDTNTWLLQNGLLKLKDGKKPSEDLNGAMDIDWSSTYAYAVGLGGIYLNFRGRESGGIVQEGAEAERVRKAIQDGLTGISDPERRVAGVRSVSPREKIYSGPYLADAPDLLVNFMPGFRVSWQSALGGFSHSLFQDNDRYWSGDHIIDPEAVPGILFMNKAATISDCNIVDLAPTILRQLQVPTGTAMEGKSIL